MKTILPILRKTLSINTLIVVLCLMIYSIGVSATVRYVKPIPTGTADGSSWDNASDDIQTMINASAAGDSVWVAAGEYKPNSYPLGCTNCTDTRDYTFHINKDLKFFGNFNGTETDINQRNFGGNTTFLSGDLNGDDVVNGSFTNLTITNNSENVYHAVIVLDTNSGNTPVTIDGFTIKGGNANDNLYYIVNGFFIYKNRGGGILIENVPATITNCFIVYNSANYGGAISCYNEILVVTGNIIANNIAAFSGGGVSLNSTYCEITNNGFIGNKSQNNGGAISCFGIECHVIKNEVIGNTALYDGGGLYLSGANNTIVNNTLTNNYATHNGGAIFGNIGAGKVSGNIIAHNSVGSNGGGLYIYFGLSPIINNVFYNNNANFNGGGLFVPNGTNKFINNTLVNNNANNYGGGIYLSLGTSTLTNNIFWNNKLFTVSNLIGADLFYNGGIHTFQNNILQIDSSFYTGQFLSLGANAQGNLFAQNPMFLNIDNPAGEDLLYLTGDDGLRLQTNSPAINAGTLTDAPETDILGTTRDSIPDIGAYEHGVVVGIQPNTGSTPTATLNAYPNPATDAITFTFTTPITDISTLLLYAINGQNITTLYKATTQAGQTNSLIIDTKAFTPGTYCAVLRCGNGLAQHRTIIIK